VISSSLYRRDVLSRHESRLTAIYRRPS
jgi:hypothetical protein